MLNKYEFVTLAKKNEAKPSSNDSLSGALSVGLDKVNDSQSSTNISDGSRFFPQIIWWGYLHLLKLTNGKLNLTIITLDMVP